MLQNDVILNRFLSGFLFDKILFAFSKPRRTSFIFLRKGAWSQQNCFLLFLSKKRTSILRSCEIKKIPKTLERNESFFSEEMKIIATLCIRDFDKLNNTSCIRNFDKLNIPLVVWFKTQIKIRQSHPKNVVHVKNV